MMASHSQGSDPSLAGGAVKLDLERRHHVLAERKGHGIGRGDHRGERGDRDRDVAPVRDVEAEIVERVGAGGAAIASTSVTISTGLLTSV